jgi:hypothetical protein
LKTPIKESKVDSVLSVGEREAGMLDNVIKTIIGGVIAYYLPKLLKATDVTETRTPWFAWVVASFIGGAIGGTASALLGSTFLSLAGFGNWAIFGACLGIAQQTAIKKYVPATSWWAVASTVGWALYPLGQIWAPVLVGFALGVLQALTLPNVSGKSWWIGGNLVIWPLVTIIGLTIFGPVMGALGPVLGWIVIWGLAGMLGAILLIYPLSQLSVKSST